jgi:methionyl-tRNA formyltransferase
VKNTNLNFVFWGTPDVASETLEILKQNGYVPALVVTSPDAPKGRKMIVTPPPVKIWAQKNDVPFLQPEKFDEEFTNKLKAVSYELFIVVAYGRILPEKIIDLPKLGSINIHYSLLPKYRGASPVESAIRSGESETGVTIQKMAFKMDSGPIISKARTNIPPDEKAPDLRKRLISLGGELLVKTLNTQGWIETDQDEADATYCRKIKKGDGLVDLEKESPAALYNKFRAYAGWPRTFFFKDKKRMIITQARLENNKFVIEKVIPEGGKEIEYNK